MFSVASVMIVFAGCWPARGKLGNESAAAAAARGGIEDNARTVRDRSTSITKTVKWYESFAFAAMQDNFGWYCSLWSLDWLLVVTFQMRLYRRRWFREMMESVKNANHHLIEQKRKGSRRREETTADDAAAGFVDTAPVTQVEDL
jgi:hypothetical protein